MPTRKNYRFILVPLLLFSGCIALFTKCFKEHIDVRKVDFSKLECSFYKLSKKSVEVSHEDLNQLLISKSESNISFMANAINDAVSVGTIAKYSGTL